MTVITISRQYGSGGDEIARRLSEILGYTYFDKRQIVQAAAEVGLSEQEIVDYSEDSHKVRTFLDRLLGRPAVLVQSRVWKEGPGGSREPEETRLTETAVMTLVQKSILSAYEAGNVVILGRGGQVLLKDKPGVMHIRTEAPMENRIIRVREQMKQSRQSYNADIEPRRQAQDLIEERDQASADYISHFYQADWNDPMLYHMVINTGRVGIEQAAQCLAKLAAVFDAQPMSGEQAPGA